MAEGLTNTAIAQRLFLSQGTVEAHVRHVLLKLDIAENDEGTVHWAQRGIHCPVQETGDGCVRLSSRGESLG